MPSCQQTSPTLPRRSRSTRSLNHHNGFLFFFFFVFLLHPFLPPPSPEGPTHGTSHSKTLSPRHSRQCIGGDNANPRPRSPQRFTEYVLGSTTSHPWTFPQSLSCTGNSVPLLFLFPFYLLPTKKTTPSLCTLRLQKRQFCPSWFLPENQKIAPLSKLWKTSPTLFLLLLFLEKPILVP